MGFENNFTKIGVSFKLTKLLKWYGKYNFWITLYFTLEEYFPIENSSTRPIASQIIIKN